MAMGVLMKDPNKALIAIILPLLVAAGGIVASILGTFFVRARMSHPSTALRVGSFSSSIMVLAIVYGIVSYTTGASTLFWPVLAGVVAGVLIGLMSEYYTSADYGAVKSIAEASKTGPATNIIQDGCWYESLRQFRLFWSHLQVWWRTGSEMQADSAASMGSHWLQ